jgi:hypothetical protein
MEIKEITTIEKTIYHKYCDKCGVEIKTNMACSVAKCEICKKDLCNKCVDYEEPNTGDYRTVYCKECWAMGAEYRKTILDYENEIDRLTEEWYNKCKK